MTWRRIVLKNTLRTAHRYFGYLSSATLAVLVYFMFSCFTANPAVQNGNNMTGSARVILTGCQYVIVVFAVFFVMFFHAALLRLRSREFGLFTVLGVTPKQIRASVFAESLGFGALSLAVGGILGTLLTKLFLMAMASILHLPDAIPFMVPHRAIWNTLIIFGVVFLVDGLLSAIRISRATPKNLLMGGRVKQTMPKFSIGWVAVSVVCIGVSYYLAVFRSNSAVMTFFPILLLVTVGTYLLFSQAAVFFVQSIRKRPLSGEWMLIIGRLAYRLKDNARVLTVVTVLSAAVLCGMGSVIGLDSITTPNALRISPVSAMLALPDAPALQSMKPDALQNALANHHISVSQSVSTPLIVAAGPPLSRDKKTDRASQVILVSESEFNRLRAALIRNDPSIRDNLNAPPSPRNGHADLFIPYPMVSPQASNIARFTVKIPGGTSEPLLLDGHFDTRIFNEQSSAVLPNNMLMVSDSDYASLSKGAPTASRWTVYSYLTPNWSSMQTVANELTGVVSTNRYVSFTTSAYVQAKQVFSVMIFAGFFVSTLFFLACGSAIYFRLQAQREDDMRQFKSLRRLGMHRQELSRVLTTELLMLFALPVLVAIVHSVFAMVDFANLLNLHRMAGDIWPVFAAVVGLYTACLMVYFMVARVRHARNVIE